ncbi:MAG TPA: hypothetical protein GXX17_00140, partial [Clostridiales bacterium]|nr:hypothetical protein [Clostridiales bacterium]
MENNKPQPSGVGIFNITDPKYGADSANSVIERTAAIQKAIDDASEYGCTKGNKNGIVYVPAGVYEIGNLILKSNTSFYLEGGAVLLASASDKNIYSNNGHKSSMGMDYTWWISTEFEAITDPAKGKYEVLSGSYDIKIFGRGTIDGNEKNMVRNLNFGNNTVVPIACSYFTMEGLTVTNSVMWSIVPVRSNDLRFSYLKMYNSLSPLRGENDCIDVCESQNVVVEHCIGISLDDPFTTKAWPLTTGITVQWPGFPEIVDNVVFDNCLSWTYCYGLKIGQGVDESHSNVTFKNSTVYDCAVGISIHHKYGRGTVENVTFDNITIERVNNKNEVHRTWFTAFIQSADRGPGKIKNVTVKNIDVLDKGTTGAKIFGYDENHIVDGITFENIRFFGSTKPANTLEQLDITNLNPYFANVFVKGDPTSAIQAIYFNSSDKVSITSNTDPEGGGVGIKGRDGGYALYNNVDFGNGVDKIDVRLSSLG